MTMTASSSLLALLQLLLLAVTRGFPYTIVTSGKGYCRSAEMAKDTIVKVLFEAPDMVFDEKDPKSGPAYLAITEKATQSALNVIEEQEGRGRRKKAAPKASPPVSHEMKHVEGSFVHHVKQDSEVTVCIRASSAGSRNPMRFAFRLEEMGDDEVAGSQLPPAKTVDHNLGFMEQQLERIESQMHAVLREADFAKERDSIYHAKTDAMHQATIFWPIVHVCILLVTGFTQANHIVQFFKKHKII